jgi:hypothetical protein
MHALKCESMNFLYHTMDRIIGFIAGPVLYTWLSGEKSLVSCPLQ